MATNLTTVNINRESQKELKKLSQSWGMSQVEFLNHAIWYFKKTGINPNSPVFSPKEELAKLDKRLGQVIMFLRHQEKDKLTPLLDEIIIAERRLKENLARSITQGDLNPIKEVLNQILEIVRALLIKGENNKKNFKGLIALFFEALKNSDSINMNEKDRERFIDAILKV